MATPSKSDHESFARARARKEAALASLRELELAEAEERLVDIGKLMARLEPALGAVRAAVQGSALAEAEKRNLLQALADGFTSAKAK